jgi:hypothetical protein
MSEAVNATVVFVDPERLTLTCCSTDGGSIYQDVAYSGVGWLGEGVEAVPEIGSNVELEFAGGEARLLRAVQMRGLGGAFTRMASGFKRGLANTVFHRRKLPGEASISAVNGAGALFGRGRSASIFSGDLAQLHILGVMNTIKAIASNFDVVGSGFRAYSENVDGRVLTRLCFTPDPANLAKAAAAGGDTAPGCEFQIDVDGPCLTVFVRGRDEGGSLVNRIAASFGTSGEITLRCGSDISREGMSSEFRMGDGFIRETVFAPKNEKGVAPVVYRRTVSKTLDGSARLEEEIVGNVSRTVHGDYRETVAGTRSVDADRIENTAVALNEYANVRVVTAGMNNDESLGAQIKPIGGADA